MSLTASVAVPGVDVPSALAPLAMLGGDPTIHLDERTMTRATFTPEGPGAIRAVWHPERSEVSLTTYGAGSSWLLECGPGLVGASDDVSSFRPTDPVVSGLLSRFRGDRANA